MMHKCVSVMLVPGVLDQTRTHIFTDNMVGLRRQTGRVQDGGSLVSDAYIIEIFVSCITIQFPIRS